MLKKKPKSKIAPLKSPTIGLEGAELKLIGRLGSRKRKVEAVQRAFEKTRHSNEVFSVKRG